MKAATFDNNLGVAVHRPKDDHWGLAPAKAMRTSLVTSCPVTSQIYFNAYAQGGIFKSSVRRPV